MRTLPLKVGFGAALALALVSVGLYVAPVAPGGPTASPMLVVPPPAAGRMAAVPSRRLDPPAASDDPLPSVLREPVTSVAPAPEPVMAPLPAAFREMPSELNLTVAQQETLANIRDAFVNEIGGPGQDPADPEYAARWNQARALSDERFRLHFGEQAFLATQYATLREGR